MYLALVENDGIVLEVFLRKCPQSVLHTFESIAV